MTTKYLLPSKETRTVRVREVADSIQYGHTASARASQEGPRFLRITDIQNGTVDWDTVPSCNIGQEDISKYRLSDGDLVFARTGATTGKSYLVRNCPDAVFASYLIRVRASKDVDPSYLACFFQSPDYWRQIEEGKRGIGQPNVNGKTLGEIKLPLPPLDEQQRIVAEIEKQFTRLDAGVASLKQVQIALKRYRASVLKAACEGRLVPTEAELQNSAGKSHNGFETGQQLLSRIRNVRANKIRVGEIRKPRTIDRSFLKEPSEAVPEGWALGRVEDFSAPEDNAIVDGPFGSNLKLSDYKPDGKFPVITITNIDEGFDLASLRKVTKEKFEKVKRSAVRAGDILVAKIGSSFGKTGIYPSHMPVGIIPANLLKITPATEMNWKYLFYYLCSLTFKNHLDTIVQYTAQPAFNVSKFKLLPVLIPPLAEQSRIVAEVERRLSVMEELESVVSSNLRRAVRLRQSILRVQIIGTPSRRL